MFDERSGRPKLLDLNGSAWPSPTRADARRPTTRSDAVAAIGFDRPIPVENRERAPDSARSTPGPHPTSSTTESFVRSSRSTSRSGLWRRCCSIHRTNAVASSLRSSIVELPDVNGDDLVVAHRTSLTGQRLSISRSSGRRLARLPSHADTIILSTTIGPLIRAPNSQHEALIVVDRAVLPFPRARRVATLRAVVESIATSDLNGPEPHRLTGVDKTERKEAMTWRRHARTLTVALLLVVGWATPAGASQERKPVEARLAATSTLVDVNETGQGKWIQLRNAIGEGVGPATVGAESYLLTAAVEVSGKINSTFTAGRKTAVVHATLTPLAGGSDITCDGKQQYRNVEADELFGFAEVGYLHLWCDNGTKITADLYGAFEIDPGSGLPVFFFNITGEAQGSI